MNGHDERDHQEERSQRELDETLADNAMAETRAEWLARSHGPEPEYDPGWREEQAASLGEQQHDSAQCDRAGRPHLGPCIDPAEPGRAIVSSWDDVVRDREADAESSERAADAARALAEYLGPDEQGFGDTAEMASRRLDRMEARENLAGREAGE